MNITVDIARRALLGAAGSELLGEIWSADWTVPAAKKVQSTNDLAIGVHLGSRRERNEDRAGIASVKSLCGQKFTVALVCDGVGGSEMGDMAATVAMASCVGDLAELSRTTPIRELLPRLIRNMDDAVRRALGGKGATTASVLLASSTGDVAAANIGDSRLFAWSHAKQQLRQVSIDDTIENELQNLPGKDFSALNARGLQGSLSQALGETGRSSSDLKIIVFERDQFAQGAIIASDGAWKSSPDGFTAIVRNAPSAEDLVRRVIASTLWMGGIDNVSVIAIQELNQFIALASNNDLNSFHNRIMFWFADTKLILTNVYGRKQPDPEQQAGRRVPGKRNSPPVKNVASKSPGRGRKKKADVDDVEAQLAFNDDRETRSSDHYNDAKPKIEISTDDEPSKIEKK